MTNYLNNIKTYIGAHKKLIIFVIIILGIGGYWGYKKLTATTGETRYVTQTAAKATIVSSVTGSGQVSASNQIDIKPEVSGTIISINIKPGNSVSSGQTLFSIDNKDALKSIRDAEINLENTKISLEKLKLQNSTESMNADLSKAYDDGFNTVSNTFLDLPTIITGLNDIFFKSDTAGRLYINKYAESAGNTDRDKAIAYRDSVTSSYNTARKAYDATFEKYKNTSRNSDSADIELLITETYNTTKLIADAIKTSNNYIDFVNDSMEKNNFDIPSYIANHRTILNGYTSKTNSALINLLSIKTSIKTYKDAFPSADLDVQSSALSLKQKENALADLKADLSKYKIVAPFSGIIASVPVQVGESASSGTTMATIITSKKLATISLNEVDIAKIKLGQKSTITFDAVPDLTISGKVEEIDSIGTVSQGVVNYNVKISFDTNDSRIKSGMSVSATVITSIKQNVLTVPNSAVKTQNSENYVLTFDTALPSALPGIQGSASLISPTKVIVLTGVSSDTLTEIISGIKEGEIVVTKTISGTATTTTSTKSILSSMGGNKAGGAPRD